jgi:RNA polymerase sigma-70 factor (ECF subfamily)
MAKDDEISHRFVEGVRRFVSKRVPASDVDDVVQDVFVRVSRGLSQLHEDERAEAWILEIARKAIADFYRKRERQVPNVSEEMPEPADTSALPLENLSHYPGEHDVHEEVLSWLRPMADEITEPYRTALIKADFEKVSQRRLAHEFGISESGLKSRVQRARKLLADVLQRCCKIEFGGEGRAVAFRRLRACRCDP